MSIFKIAICGGKNEKHNWGLCGAFVVALEETADFIQLTHIATQFGQKECLIN